MLNGGNGLFGNRNNNDGAVGLGYGEVISFLSFDAIRPGGSLRRAFLHLVVSLISSKSARLCFRHFPKIHLIIFFIRPNLR